MKFLIPGNIDLDELIKRVPEGLKIKRDMLIVFMNLIYQRQFTYVKDKNPNPYVNLKASILQTYVINYKEYLGFLENQGIIKINPLYKVGCHSKSYKFNEPFHTKGKMVELFDSNLKKKMSQKKKPTPNRQHLYHQKWYRPELEIEMDSAMIDFESQYIKEAKVSKRKAIQRYNMNLIGVYRIEQCEYSFSVDNNTGRVYANIVYMSKISRKHLRYNNGNFKNARFVEVDLKNSQPFFLLALLNPNMYEGYITDITQPSVFTFDIYSKSLNISAFTSDIYSNSSNIKVSFQTIQKLTKVIPDIQKYYNSNSTIMILKYLQGVESKNIRSFRRSVIEGRYYEWIQHLFESIGYEKRDRAFYKDLALKSFFLDPRLLLNRKYLNNKRYEPCQVFWNMNPELLNLVSIFKQGDYKRFSLILTAIEAYVMVERVAKRISKEFPLLPYYLIHDCVLTIEGFEEQISRIIREECYKAIGYIPKLDIKYQNG